MRDNNIVATRQIQLCSGIFCFFVPSLSFVCLQTSNQMNWDQPSIPPNIFSSLRIALQISKELPRPSPPQWRYCCCCCLPFDYKILLYYKRILYFISMASEERSFTGTKRVVGDGEFCLCVLLAVCSFHFSVIAFLCATQHEACSFLGNMCTCEFSTFVCSYYTMFYMGPMPISWWKKEQETNQKEKKWQIPLYSIKLCGI